MIEYLYMQNIGASSVNDLMTDADTGEAQTRFVGRPSKITFAIEASAVGCELEIYSGSRTIVARSTLDAGGTDGVFPNLNEKTIQWFAAAGEKQRIIVRETAAAGNQDLMGVISVDPIA